MRSRCQREGTDSAVLCQIRPRNGFGSFISDTSAERIRQFYVRSVRGADSAVLCQIRSRNLFGSFMSDPSAERIWQFYVRSVRGTDSAVLCQIRPRNGFGSFMSDPFAERIRHFYVRIVRGTDSAVQGECEADVKSNAKPMSHRARSRCRKALTRAHAEWTYSRTQTI